MNEPVKPDDIDTIIHERVRLSIVAALAVSPQLSFNELRGERPSSVTWKRCGRSWTEETAPRTTDRGRYVRWLAFSATYCVLQSAFPEKKA
jgi:hypothetical protein